MKSAHSDRIATGDPTEGSRVLSAALAEVARRLGLRTTELRQVIGASQSSVSRLMHGKWQLPPGTKSFELAAHVVRLYRSLSALVGGDDALARAWLRSANTDFDGREPLSLLASVEGLVHVCDYLDAFRARV